MYINPIVPQLLAIERMKDAIRRNEQTRLIRMAENSGQPQRRRFFMIFTRKNSLALLNNRSINNLPQTRPIYKEP